jgi:hypothetical protein
MPLVEWICICPGDAGRLTLVANKCSIIRNAPGRMNMHPPRWRWYTNPRRQQVLHCPKCPWMNEYASATTPSPFFFPDLSELHHCCPPVLPRRHAHVAGRRFFWRYTCEEEGSRLLEQPQSLHLLESSRWAKRLSTSPLPRLWYGSGGGGADVEGRWKPQSSLFLVCKELSGSLLCLPNLS